MAAYVALFRWFSRAAAYRIYSFPLGCRSVVLAGLLLVLLLLSLKPIYGGGENLLGGGGHFDNLYVAYRHELFRPYLHAWRNGPLTALHDGLAQDCRRTDRRRRRRLAVRVGWGYVEVLQRLLHTERLLRTVSRWQVER